MDTKDLVNKAKDLAANVPEDLKEKATKVVEEAEKVEKKVPDDVKEKAGGFISDVKDKFGL